MSEIEALGSDIAAAAAPARGPWRRYEPTILGAGGIVLLLAVWEALPRLVTLSAGTKLFFTTPSHVVGTLWEMFATGSIWSPLGVSAGAFALGLGIAIVVALPLGDAERAARPLHHRVQRDAAAGLPAARHAVVRARPVVEGGDRVHRRAVSAADQHLRGRAQRRQAADQRGALVRRRRMGDRAPGDRAERAALHRGRPAARHR